VTVGSHQRISLNKKEQDVIWDFIPHESGHNKIQLILEGLDINRDVVLDEYGSHIPIGEKGNLHKILHKLKKPELSFFLKIK